MSDIPTRATAYERPLGAQLALDLGVTAGCTLAIVIGAHLKIPLPFTPVPLTLQTLAVLLAGAFVGPRLGFAATTGYLLLSLLGLPVLAGPSFIGPTGGYVLGFILAAVLMGFSARREGWGWLVGGAVVASLTILLCGSLWLSAYTAQDWARALQLGMLPFLPGDALKTAAAVLIVRRFGLQVRRRLA